MYPYWEPCPIIWCHAISRTVSLPVAKCTDAATVHHATTHKRYGEEPYEPFNAEIVGSRILEYASEVQSGKYLHDPRFPKPSDIFERERLLDFMNNCSETYLTRSDPRRFLWQRALFERVSGTEGTTVMVEVSPKDFLSYLENAAASAERSDFVISFLVSPSWKTGISNGTYSRKGLGRRCRR